MLDKTKIKNTLLKKFYLRRDLFSNCNKNTHTHTLED